MNRNRPLSCAACCIFSATSASVVVVAGRADDELHRRAAGRAGQRAAARRRCTCAGGTSSELRPAAPASICFWLRVRSSHGFRIRPAKPDAHGRTPLMTKTCADFGNPCTLRCRASASPVRCSRGCRICGVLISDEQDALVLLRREFAAASRAYMTPVRASTPTRISSVSARKFSVRAAGAGRRGAGASNCRSTKRAEAASAAASWLQQLRAHHRRQRQRDEAGDDDRARQREGELAEQRAGHARDEADRRVDRGQRDRHRDDRQRDLARAADRRVERRHARPRYGGGCSPPRRSRRRPRGRWRARAPAG